MVTIGMNYRVLEGQEEVFEGACRKVLGAQQRTGGPAQPHHLPRMTSGSS